MLELAATPFRYHEFLYEYWTKVRGNRLFPMMNEMDGKELGEVWKSCFIVGVSGDEVRSWHYLHKGEELLQMEKAMPEVADYFYGAGQPRVEKLYREVLTNCKPLIEKAELVDSRKQVVRYRRCLLPLDGGKGVPTFIIGCVRWKVFTNTGGKHEKKTFNWEDPRIR